MAKTAKKTPPFVPPADPMPRRVDHEQLWTLVHAAFG
jgi:hypothetical protein